MSEFKGTPGPWGFIIDKEDGESIVALLYSATETFVIDADYDGSLMLKKDDANLIAAAPDLLDALMDCVGRLTEAFPVAENYEPIIAARAAIAKALGEQK